MLILCRVAAEFRDDKGDVIYKIGMNERNSFLEAPDSLKDNLLFKLMVQDGSIVTPETSAQKKALENNPMAGVGADGKSIFTEDKEADKTEEKISEASVPKARGQKKSVKQAEKAPEGENKPAAADSNKAGE